MLVRVPYFFFILMVCCWFRHNAAVPLASHSSNQMQDTFKEKETDSQSDLDDTTLDSRSIRETKAFDITSDDDDKNDENEENNDDNDDDDDENKIQNTINNVNRNVNKNINTFNRDHHQSSSHRTRNRKRHKQSTTEDITTVTEYRTLEEIAKEEASTNCASSNKKNQRYSSSFFGNTTNQSLTVEKEFHDVVGNNSKVKKSSSVHEGEDITLCWIETTTIKEDKTIRPSKRLVIREYTISFENSATIPERYLECKRYEGELTANDPDVGKTALFEIIDEDTMVSRIVNFTSVNHVGNITTWEHKKVKCGVGPVVSKNVIELTDDSKNPKKRVEIKVSPKMHQLTATTTDEEEPCTESSEEESSTLTEFTEHTTELSCENGVCETTRIPPSISPKNGYEFSTAEETVTKLSSKAESESEEDHSLSTVTKSSSVEKVSRRSTIFPKISTPTQEYQEKIDCKENPSDPACLMQKHDISSSEKLFPESAEVSTTEAVTVIKTSSIPISDKEKTTREAISLSSVEGKLTTQTSLTPREEKKVTSDLETEETTPFAIVTDISMEFSKAHTSQSTDQASIDEGSTTSLETKIISATEEVEEYPVSEESNIDLTSEEIEKVDRVTGTNIVTSVEVDSKPDVTATIPIKFIKFTKGSDKPDQRDKLSEPPSSTETTTRTVIIESSSTSKEVSSEESKEGVTSAVFLDGSTRVGLKTSSEEEKFISISTRTSPMIVELTTLSPVISSEIGYSCENSEECAYTSLEVCDEFGNCGETTTKCDSEVCSEEEVTKDRSKFDTSSPSTMKILPFATSSQTSSEESEMIETQYTTVASVATTTLTSRESEDNATAVNNVPITTDTRRSTTTSTPRHKMTLIVKILLEHTNENKEKQNLVEVEKHLSLDENPEHHNPDLLKQLKSLNDSINMETISALLNCTSLGNWTRDSNFVNKELDDAVDDSDEELESTNSDLEDSMSASGYADAKNDYSDYEEVRSRRRRSLDKMEELDRFVRQNLNNDSIDSVINFVNQSEVDSVNLRNISTSQKTELIKDTLTLSTTINYIEEETTENEGPNVSNEADESTIPSTTITFNITDLLNATKSYKNVTKGNVQLTPTTNKPETTSAVYIENGKNIIIQKNESAIPLIKEDISNETKMEVMRETLPGIQEDVVVGLQHMVSQLMESNLTSIGNIKEAFKTNLLDILADPKDTRVGSRRRRAATEEVGHWSNERIKEVPMGGNLRSLTEFTLYKVLL